MTTTPPTFSVHRLAWDDAELGNITLGTRDAPILASFGSGLARRSSDPAGIAWAISDRGPNLKPETLVKRFGMQSMRALETLSGAKVMPRPDIGPRIAKLRIHDDKVELVEEIRICLASGTPVSGLPPKSSAHALSEPVFDLAGNPLPLDPNGLDTEGIIALSSGGFWVADEFGPSLVRLDESGQVVGRYVPEGWSCADAECPIHPVLPAIAARRQLNRGFEGIAMSPDEATLFVAFQSPLAHPDEAAHKAARHVRVWCLDAVTLQVTAQYLYPLDEPASFVRDCATGLVDWSDLKVSELVALSHDELLVLERGSETTKIYRVTLTSERALPAAQLAATTRPTVEQLSAAGEPLPELVKTLLLSSDEVPELVADLEGMVVLSSSELLLVNDNDFGVEGTKTRFAKIVFDTPVFAV